MAEVIIPESLNVPSGFKSGYVSLAGKPNVGKSTLLNRLVEQKIAAMSRRPQTTRNKITGVCHLPGGQIVLLDTPGIHPAKGTLNRLLVKTSLSTFEDADLILFMISAREKFTADDAFVLDALQGSATPKILVINKIDLAPKPGLLQLMDDMRRRGPFLEMVPVSALHDSGMDVLKKVILDHLPVGPPYFPEDMVTDRPEEFLTGEIIREKVIKLTHLEIPYAVAVEVDSMREGRHEGVTVIEASILVEKTSQKKIIIGEGGKVIKKIGSQARQELERRLGGSIFLNLFVKVKERWREDMRTLRRLGYTHDSR